MMIPDQIGLLIQEADEQQEDGDYLYDVVDMKHELSEYDYYPEWQHDDGTVDAPEAWRLHLHTWTVRIGVSFSEQLSPEETVQVERGFALMDFLTRPR